MADAIYINAWTRTVERIDFDPAKDYGGLSMNDPRCRVEELANPAFSVHALTRGRGQANIPHFGVDDRFFAGEVILFGGVDLWGDPIAYPEVLPFEASDVVWFGDEGCVEYAEDAVAHA